MPQTQNRPSGLSISPGLPSPQAFLDATPKYVFTETGVYCLCLRPRPSFLSHLVDTTHTHSARARVSLDGGTASHRRHRSTQVPGIRPNRCAARHVYGGPAAAVPCPTPRPRAPASSGPVAKTPGAGAGVLRTASRWPRPQCTGGRAQRGLTKGERLGLGRVRRPAAGTCKYPPPRYLSRPDRPSWPGTDTDPPPLPRLIFAPLSRLSSR